MERNIKIILHKKIERSNKCICNGTMEVDNFGNWICKRMIRNKEPKHIWTKISQSILTELIKEDKNG